MAMLGGCSDQRDGYPSLAPRPIEQVSLAEPRRAEAPVAEADPATLRRLAPLVAQARAADAEFRRVLEAERATLRKGRGAAEGGDAWLAAQASQTRIEAARSPVAKVLADLDAARSGLSPQDDTGTLIAISQAFDQVSEIANAEAAALSAVTGAAG
jgi:hypothetical protein